MADYNPQMLHAITHVLYICHLPSQLRCSMPVNGHSDRSVSAIVQMLLSILSLFPNVTFLLSILTIKQGDAS